MDSPHNPTLNRLLAELPETELAQLRPHLQRVHLELGRVLYEPGRQATHLYFPIDCVISKICLLLDGSSAETAVVGKEGVVGIALFMGDGTTSTRMVVQVAGDAYRLSGKLMKDEFYRSRDLQQVLLRYVQALLAQMGQTAICNRHHTIEQQLCRWLLESLDRLPTNEVNMTQELIAGMLGVRREGVTAAARKLSRDGIISYHRGCIIVNDRQGLEARCCECHEVVRKEYDRLQRGLKHLQ